MRAASAIVADLFGRERGVDEVGEHRPALPVGELPRGHRRVLAAAALIVLARGLARDGHAHRLVGRFPQALRDELLGDLAEVGLDDVGVLPDELGEPIQALGARDVLEVEDGHHEVTRAARRACS
jgi:hypothetical protein